MASRNAATHRPVQLGLVLRQAPAVLTQVREDPAVIAALGVEAERAGIASTEAIRQLIDGYLADPWKFQPRTMSDTKTGTWSAIKVSDQVVQDFTLCAERGGVSVAEAVRQIVRRYLNESVRKQGGGKAGRA